MQRVEKIKKPPKPYSSPSTGIGQAIVNTAVEMGLVLDIRKGAAFYFIDPQAKTTHLLKLKSDGSIVGKPSDLMRQLHSAAQSHPALGNDR